MQNHCFFRSFWGICYKNVLCWPLGIELKHLCLEYMTPWLRNLVRFCKHNDDAKRQRVTAILDKLITMTINEKQMYPSIQAKIWGSLGQVGPWIWFYELIPFKRFQTLSADFCYKWHYNDTWLQTVTPLYISAIIQGNSVSQQLQIAPFYMYRSQTCWMWCWIAS